MSENNNEFLQVIKKAKEASDEIDEWFEENEDYTYSDAFYIYEMYTPALQEGFKELLAAYEMFQNSAAEATDILKPVRDKNE